jgi:hypothetical protein
VGSVVLIGANHLSPLNCGGAEHTLQAACGVPQGRVHDLSS